MKILHLCLSAFFIDNYSYQENILAKYHAKQGHDVTVIASLFTFNTSGRGVFLSQPAEYQDKNGFKVMRLAYKKPIRWNRLFRHYIGLDEALERISPDLIFSHCVSFGDATIVKHYLYQHPNVVFYADNHTDYVNSAKNWLSKYILHPLVWRYYAKQLEPFMKKCWGVTPLRCRFLKEMYHINPNLIGFLPMGVDDESIPIDRKRVYDTIRKELGVREEDILVFTGGKIDRLKNTHVLIESLVKLNDEHLHLVICGILTDEMDYLKELINGNHQIHYLGWCDAERVMNCMVASDIACFPGTHSTLWEQTVGVGLPIICKHWDGMDHVNINGNCRFINGEDVTELSEMLKELTQKEMLQSVTQLAVQASSLFLYSNISKKAIGE